MIEEGGHSLNRRREREMAERNQRVRRSETRETWTLVREWERRGKPSKKIPHTPTLTISPFVGW